MRSKIDDMPDILKQRSAIHTHCRNYCQRQQRDRHDHDADGSGHGNQCQFRITQSQHQNHRFNSVPGFDHPAQQLAAVRIVCGNGIHIVVFFVVQISSPSCPVLNFDCRPLSHT